ncbi:uncharacterized protein LOC144175473 [Haemaphysalis longicornis]
MAEERHRDPVEGYEVPKKFDGDGLLHHGRSILETELRSACVENHTEPVRLDKAGQFMYTGSGNNWFLLAYDTSETMQTKMKKFFELMGSPAGRRGWAVYDVDFDDYSNKCNYSSNFHGLRTVSKFLQS